MKLLRVYFVFICFFMALASCQKKSQQEERKDVYEEASNATQDLQEKAAQDTGFAKSKDYAAQMERAGIQMAKQTAQMDTNEKLLLEFEIALRNLKQSSEKVKQAPNLLKNKKFVELLQEKVATVRDLRKKLQDAKLADAEKVRFDELCRQ